MRRKRWRCTSCPIDSHFRSNSPENCSKKHIDNGGKLYYEFLRLTFINARSAFVSENVERERREKKARLQDGRVTNDSGGDAK